MPGRRTGTLPRLYPFSVRAAQIHGDRDPVRRVGPSYGERNGGDRYQAHLPTELHTHAESDDPERRRVRRADPEPVRQLATGMRVRDRRRGHELHLLGTQRDHSGSEAELDIALAVIVPALPDVPWAAHECDREHRAYLRPRLLVECQLIAHAGSEVER